MKPVKHYVSNPYYALLSMVAYTHNLSGIWIQLATTWRYSTVGNIYAPNNASQKIKSHALLLLPHNDSTVINRHCNSSHTEHSLHNFNMYYGYDQGCPEWVDLWIFSISYKRYIYRKLPKIRPPFLHTTFIQKWGGGVCLNIQFISCIRPLPPFLVVMNTHEFNNHDN